MDWIFQSGCSFVQQIWDTIFCAIFGIELGENYSTTPSSVLVPWTSNLLSALFMTNRGGRVMTVRLTKPYYSDVYAQMSRPTIRCEPVDRDLETTINVGTNWGLECTCCLLHLLALVNRLWDGPFWFAPEVPWTRTVLLSLASQSRDIISLPGIWTFFLFFFLSYFTSMCNCMQLYVVWRTDLAVPLLWPNGPSVLCGSVLPLKDVMERWGLLLSRPETW